MADPLVPIPAASVVLMRPGAGSAAPELLMVERSASLAFAPGALTFPGGRIDPGDHMLADTAGVSPADTAARIAAVREAIEEVGIAPGLDLSTAEIVALRAHLASGGALDRMPQLDALVPFAHWRPAGGVSRIFDTRFYLVELSPAALSPSVDGTENARLLWGSADAILAAADRGAVALLFPTRRILERLARFGSFAAAAADARAGSDTVVTPWVEHRDGVPHLCIPDGLGYPVTAEPLAQVTRG